MAGGLTQAALDAAARGFGGRGPIRTLAEGRAWRLARPDGDIVLKPAPHPDEVPWLAETMAALPDLAGVRLPRPVAGDGGWTVAGMVAWTWLDGATATGRYAAKLGAARAFHRALSGLERPRFFDDRHDPWALADRVAWGERAADYDAETMAVLAPILAEAAALPPPDAAQIVHADLSGNYVFADGLAPGIIDVTPYWRPPSFAEAVVWVDSIWMAAADPADFAQPQMRGAVLRALARRIAEQPEQVAAGLKPAADAASVVRTLARAVPRLLAPWPAL